MNLKKKKEKTDNIIYSENKKLIVSKYVPAFKHG